MGAWSIMLKRLDWGVKKKKPKKRLDISELAHSIVEQATNPVPDQSEKPPETTVNNWDNEGGAIPEAPPDTSGKNPAAVSLGRLGGLKGGKARAKSMTKKERSEAAKKAAEARWGKNDLE